ncbi:hypothetical protein JIR23_28550 [Bradyrhizobium diazoefficiens]|nr:hypothetical protein [Bradyrhizobium diazoefficiens]QQN63427.1 hypothetical protein JIR23_28550 [Bradyrhizobium diazoefficiens]
MANPKKTDLELSLTAVELALAFDDLLEESARNGAARIEAMSDDEIERLLAPDGELSPPREKAFPAATILWQGFLESLVPMKAVADAALSDEHADSGHVGVKIDLKTILGDQLDRDDMTWASGPLRVEAAYSDAKTISSLRISVGVKRPFRGKSRPLSVALADRASGLETVSLNVDRPSITLPLPALSGPFKELELKVSV